MAEMPNNKQRRTRALRMAQTLRDLFPKKSRTALTHANPWELLVATVLSAQCTDAQVNKVTEKLFRKYTTVSEYADAPLQALQAVIRPTGFYKTKARYIRNAARMVLERFDGHVPQDMEELQQLPGVGRKTANVVLANGFGIVAGIAVDTHVRRFAIRFDLTDHTDPEKIERDLMNMLPQSEWADFSHRLIFYGRQICPARTHPCKDHPLTRIYPPVANIWPQAKT